MTWQINYLLSLTSLNSPSTTFASDAASAELFDDKKRKEFIETKNKADALIYSTEKNLKDNSNKISESDKKNVEEAIAELKKAMENEDDIEQFNAKTESLAAASMKIGEAIHGTTNDPKASASEQKQSSNSSADAASDAKVVDGEFKDVSDSK
jgi:molecular chaperone DnaK